MNMIHIYEISNYLDEQIVKYIRIQIDIKEYQPNKRQE